MAQAKRLVLNPSDPTSGYILWTNGRIDTFGDAPLAVAGDGTNTPGETGYPIWYTDPNNPNPAIALTITDWTGPAGYTSNYYGSPGAWGTGGTAAPTQPASGTVPTTNPYTIVVDAQMNPNGSGQGYYLRLDGLIVPVGNAPSVGSPPVEAPEAVKLLVDWTNNAWYVLMEHGGVYAGNGAPTPSSPTPNLLANWARDFWMDFSSGAGMVLGMDGVIHAFGGAQEPFGYPTWNGDVARGLGVVSNGEGGNPLTLTVLDLNGNLYTFQSSTAPTATLTAPDGTTTTRPPLTWSYYQPQGNLQASWQVVVLTAAVAGGATDPTSLMSQATFTASGTNDSTTRSVTPDVDLANGNYVLYVQVTSNAGIASAWAYVDWTQNITLPNPPTITVQAGPGDGNITITTVAGSGDPDGFFIIQYLDPDGAWTAVRGATALPTSGSAVAVIDKEAPIGVPRQYNAVYFENQANYLASLPSATSQATATGSLYMLTDPTAGTGGPVYVTAAFVRALSARGGTFLPAGAERAVWISDGTPTMMGGTLTVTAVSQTQMAELEAMLYSGHVLLLRDVQGLANYFAVTGSISRTKIGRGAENYYYQYAVDVTEVDRPAP